MHYKPLKRPSRILIITGSAGGGHVSAARALEEESTEQGSECKIIDALNASRFFRMSTQNLYEAFVRLCPGMWGVFYDILEKNPVALRMHTRFTTANLSQLEQDILDFKPDWIICTHDVALPKIATLRRYPHNFQLAVTVTDVHPHILWIEGSAQAGAEWIFVSCCESKANILQRSNIPAERIIVSGIPIGSTFHKSPALSAQLPKLSMPTVLVTSGMIGAGRYLDVLKSLSGLETPVRIVVVCGRNKTILRKLAKLAKSLTRSTPHEYDIRGQVCRDDMAALLKRCTMLVAKPGGLTMSEAMAVGCPFVIYEPFLIPGQEQKNAAFLVDNGIGIVAVTPTKLRSIVARLLQDEGELARMRSNALRNGKPHASRHIMQKILQTDLVPIS